MEDSRDDRRRREPEFYNKEVGQFGKGLYTDSSPQVQPQGTLRFALNCVDETQEGDIMFPSNMESNIQDGVLPQGYIPIGKVYIGEGETVLFLCNPQGGSEIGVYSDKTGYATYLNEPSLNFQVTHQIDAVYRLRRGCDKTIYWTDNLNPIRQYVLNRPEDYLVEGQFNPKTLKLFKNWSKIPNFKNFNILETGSLKAGSYNFAIQYLDSDLNPTEWIITSETINIYHSNLSEEYKDLKGSSNLKTEFQNWGDSTGKAIEIELSNLDRTFDFYRIGIIEATSGSGLVSKVTASPPISTGVDDYIFTGSAETVITVEEIAQFSNVIDLAQSIEQIENKLLLGNTKGKQINFCELQKHASKIIANYTTEVVVLDQIEKFKGIPGTFNPQSESGSKDPLINTKKLGYMPGEIYSFGIVYYFKDGTSSPVYHIPGKPKNDRQRLSNMSTDNTISSKYTDSNKCETDSSYWGKDYLGNDLKDNLIRHHRFPTRAEANIGFVQKVPITKDSSLNYTLKATLFLPQSIFPGQENPGLIRHQIRFQGTYGGYPVDKSFFVDVDPTRNFSETLEIISIESQTTPSMSTVTQTNTGNFEVTYSQGQENKGNSRFGYKATIMGIEFSNIEDPQFLDDNDIVGYKIVRNHRDENSKTILDTGILFPISEYEKFLGYGHSLPNLKDANFNVRKDIYGFIHPEFLFNKKEYSQNNIEFIHAGNFERVPTKTLNSVAGILPITGDRVIENYVQDAYPGTTLDPGVHKGKDPDGLDLHTVSRFRDTEYKITPEKNIFNVDTNNNIRKIFYLDALSSISTSIGNQNKDIFNISSDNRIGIVQLENEKFNIFQETSPFQVRVPKYREGSFVNSDGVREKLFTDQRIVEEIGFTPTSDDYYNITMRTFENTPYFYLKRNLSNPYENFRYTPYYAEHDNVIPIEQQGVKIFNGDVYISPMTYNNSFYHDIKPKNRKTKSSWWKKVAGALLIVAGIVGGILTGGVAGVLTGVGVGLLGAAAGISAISSGLAMDKVNRIYNDEYEKGLKYVSRDGTTKDLFINNKTFGQFDDEIQWYNDIVNGLWFESQVNVGVRQETTLGIPAFIPSPFEYMPPANKLEMGLAGKAVDYSNEFFRRRAIEKISILEPESDGGRLYLGYAIAEYYEINKDLQRRNREKPYFHLGLEYDCCSDCVETFPHRIYYSEQSFQEELTDNFRIFLPNNYVDIDGESGEITNLFKIQNNLFVHTEEAIWKMPKNYQERVTDEIVSFIGTGSYFSIPPQKLIDDESGNSFGTRHKWSRLKTPVGYFFISESQSAVCMFDGNKVNEISRFGTYYWFENNLPIISDTENRDNPSNPEGVGFIFVYDSKKDLVFLTKKDRYSTGEDASWTMSYNLKKNSWGSWHSFMPNFYFQTPKNYYSWRFDSDIILHSSQAQRENNVWKHNALGHYQTYYNKKHPYIIEYVLTEGPLQNKTFEDITLFLESKKYDPISKTFYDVDNIFFDKLLVYNTRQCSGILNIVVKDKEDINFFMNQVSNNDLQDIKADRNERNWTINELRDMVVTKNTPMFISDAKQLQDSYFIDKKLNPAVIDYNKDWTQIESFRDKYLVVRFIFDKFVDIKLITNFSANTEKFSVR